MKDLSTRIRQARRKAELSQAALAEILRINRSAVAQWESPKGSRPTAENLSKLALATHVGFEWLATGRGRMSPRPEAESDPHLVRHEFFAHDDAEERVLAAMRKLEYWQSLALAELAENLARGGRRYLKSGKDAPRS